MSSDLDRPLGQGRLREGPEMLPPEVADRGAVPLHQMGVRDRGHQGKDHQGAERLAHRRHGGDVLPMPAHRVRKPALPSVQEGLAVFQAGGERRGYRGEIRPSADRPLPRHGRSLGHSRASARRAKTAEAGQEEERAWL